MSRDRTDTPGFEERAVALFSEWAARFRALDASPARADSDAGGKPAARPRLVPRIWELADKLLCPVIGTCLPIDEVRRLARKHGAAPAAASAFEAHVAVIKLCKSRSPLAQDVQRNLDRRHVLWVGRFEKAGTPEEVLSTWRAALERGEAAGALWGAVTCRAATDELLQQVYEDIHMFSHQMGAGARADLNRLRALEGEVAELTAQAGRARERSEKVLAGRAMRIRFLEQRVALLEAEARQMDDLRRQLDELASGRQVALMERALTAAEGEIADLTRKAGRAEALEAGLDESRAEAERLAEALARTEAERDALERLLAMSAGCDACDLEGECLNFAGRRLLCVGGRAHLQAQYRALVERVGGVLACHDGGREEAMARLPELLGQADAVICPVDCVSHAAYHQLKRHCKQTDKPCVLLRSSGLGSFAEGLRRLAAGRLDIGPADGERTAEASPVPVAGP